MPSEPPPFENAKVCAFCSAGFTLVKRKHHCRNCGKTACDTCSTKEALIPAFGFVQPVRVCNPCYDVLSRPPGGAKAETPKVGATTAAASPAPAAEPKKAASSSERKVSNCTCGLPLCTCAPDETKDETTTEEAAAQPKSEAVKPQPKPVAKPAPAATPSFFNGFGNPQTAKYDLKGDLNEQCKDAVKSRDTAGVKLLLEAKADAKFVDSRGNSLVHLAAMFDKYDMVKLLCEHGADIYQTNPAGERPIDLAPPSLQFKMQQLQPKK